MPAGEDLLPLDRLAAFLDGLGIGSGPAHAERVGDGHSNLTYLVTRDGARVIVRRPPPPPLPPSAHDMLREARVVGALAGAARVPRILGACADESVIGAPFYVMEEVAGTVVTSSVPAGVPPERVGPALVGALCELHAVDAEAVGLGDLGHAPTYLERQIRRFRGISALVETRPLPRVEELADWLAAHRPASARGSIVHGDYRLGNALLGPQGEVVAILDWELATLGDPLADLGYLTATWSEAGSPGTPIELSPVTREPGFASRRELAELYARASGADLAALPWYEVLALWKAAIFCEGLRARHLRGESGGAWAASLEAGVPAMLEAAAELAGSYPSR